MLMLPTSTQQRTPRTSDLNDPQKTKKNSPCTVSQHPSQCCFFFPLSFYDFLLPATRVTCHRLNYMHIAIGAACERFQTGAKKQQHAAAVASDRPELLNPPPPTECRSSLRLNYLAFGTEHRGEGPGAAGGGWRWGWGSLLRLSPSGW